MESFCLKGELWRRWKKKKNIYDGNLTFIIINPNAASMVTTHTERQKDTKKSKSHCLRELLVSHISIRCLFKDQKVSQILPLPGTNFRQIFGSYYFPVKLAESTATNSYLILFCLGHEARSIE